MKDIFQGASVNNWSNKAGEENTYYKPNTWAICLLKTL